MEPGNRMPTILDIAGHAGVSKSTVSRVLTRAPGVSASTRAQVAASVQALGYTVNSAARSLRTAKTAVVGLHVPAINHPVFGEIAEYLDEALRQQGVTLAITCSGWDAGGDLTALEALQSRGVEALVVATTQDRNPELGAYFRQLKLPLLLLDREFRGLSCDAVLTDHRTGTTQAVEHLASLRHQRIALLRPVLESRPGREVSAAYHAALDSLGLTSDPRLEHGVRYTDREAIADSVAKALEAGATAIVAAGATLVTGHVLRCLRERGLRIPDDISLVAFDDLDLMTAMTPTLSTISRPIARIGQVASRLIIHRLAAPDAPRQVELVPTTLIQRESVGLAPHQTRS